VRNGGGRAASCVDMNRLVSAVSVLVVVGACAGTAARVQQQPPPLKPIETPFPAPSGSHPVGVETRWVGETVVRIWYPAAARGEPAPYAVPDEEYRARLAGGLGVEPETVPDPTGIPTYATADVAPADGKWPVAIYLHGLGGHLAQNSVEAVELASHGVVVVSVAIADEAMTTPLPEGGSRAGDRMRIADVAVHALEHVVDWRDRALAVVDALRALPATDRLAAHLDVARFGAFGMSFGGAAALAACEARPDCVGSAGLDGTTVGPTIGTPVGRPHLALVTDADPDGARWVVEDAAAGADAWYVHLRGVQHFGMTDFIHLAQSPEMLGTMAAARRHEIVSRWLVAFFAGVLRGEAATIDAVAAETAGDDVEVVRRR
jgi:dienelactone hydrolase